MVQLKLELIMSWLARKRFDIHRITLGQGIIYNDRQEGTININSPTICISDRT